MYPKCYISTSYLAGMCHKCFYTHTHTHTHTHTQSGQFYNPSSKTGIVLPDFPKMSELNFTKPFPVEKVCQKSSVITSIRKGMGGGREQRGGEYRGYHWITVHLYIRATAQYYTPSWSSTLRCSTLYFRRDCSGACTNASIPTHIHTYTHMHIHMYTHAHADTHTHTDPHT